MTKSVVVLLILASTLATSQVAKAGLQAGAVNPGNEDDETKRRCMAKLPPARGKKGTCDQKKKAAEDACTIPQADLDKQDQRMNNRPSDCQQNAQIGMDANGQKSNTLDEPIRRCKAALEECDNSCTAAVNHITPDENMCKAVVKEFTIPLLSESHQGKDTCTNGQPKRNLDEMQAIQAASRSQGRSESKRAGGCNAGGETKVPESLKQALAKEDAEQYTTYRDQNQQDVDTYNRQNARGETPTSRPDFTTTVSESGPVVDQAQVEQGPGSQVSPLAQSPTSSAPQSAPQQAQQAPQQSQQQPPQQQSPQQQAASPQQQPQSQESKASAVSENSKPDAKDQTATTGTIPPMTAEQMAAAPGHSETPGTMAQAAATEEKNKANKPPPLSFVVGGVKSGGGFMSASGAVGSLGAPKNPDDEEEKLLASKGLRKPASLGGGESSSSGTGGGKGGWFSSLLGGKSENASSSSYFGKFFGGGKDEKPGEKVDLSQFLPGRNTKLDFRGIAGNARPAGVHGPHVILWNAVNDRYRSLERTLISEP